MKSPVHRDDEVAGGPIPPKCEIIEIRLAELNQIFNRMDPSPFQDKDLDPKAEEFIVGWAREFSRNAPLALSVHLDRTEGLREEAEVLRKSIQEFFSNRALVSTVGQCGWTRRQFIDPPFSGVPIRHQKDGTRVRENPADSWRDLAYSDKPRHARRLPAVLGHGNPITRDPDENKTLRKVQ